MHSKLFSECSSKLGDAFGYPQCPFWTPRSHFNAYSKKSENGYSSAIWKTATVGCIENFLATFEKSFR